MPKFEPQTVGELLFWSYANLAMMTAVLEDDAEKPGKKHFMIRSRLFAGLRQGNMNVRGYFDDEKLKLKLPKCCWYCGSTCNLSADHIIPRAKGGRDAGENLIIACRQCNSSKGSKDLLEWMSQRGQFPPLYLLRRFLKMAIEFCRQQELMDASLLEKDRFKNNLPFAIDHIPSHYPPAEQLCKWIDCTGEKLSATKSLET